MRTPQDTVLHLQEFLREIGINIFLQQPYFYVGGSLPTFMMSQAPWNEIAPHDLDVYTTDHGSAVSWFYQNKEKFEIHQIQGSIINFSVKQAERPFKIQFITAEVTDFDQEVLEYYDCSMVAIGYYPFKSQLMINHRFYERPFVCRLTHSNVDRQLKLSQRADSWFHEKINFEGKFCPSKFNQEAYSLPPPDTAPATSSTSSSASASVSILTSSPPYLQLFHQLYRCLTCHRRITENLICVNCLTIIETSSPPPPFPSPSPSPPPPSIITVLGGVNGLGGIMSKTYEELGHVVYKTTRKPTQTDQIPFELGQPMSKELLNVIECSDLLVLNATKTLEGDETVWNTTLQTFNADLLMDRMRTNLLGYVQLVRELLEFRYQQPYGSSRHLTVVYVDANESKYENKMIDGKHLELNIAKSAVKQVFYTNANLFQKLNMSIVCYDPGWLSYHGVSIEKKRSNSKHLIPPKLAVMGLLWSIEDLTSPIIDRSVYQYLRLMVDRRQTLPPREAPLSQK
jgi:hypothetical protein